MPALTEDPLLATAVDILDHKVLSPCVLLERIGEGGMGVVYHAMHLNLGIEVAVKIVPPEKAALDPTFVERFRREARAAARISHQNVVRVFDVETHGDLHYLIMEYVPGEDLLQRVRKQGALPLPEALQIVRDAALGLGAAHAEGIVHRDVKPGNLLISPRGHVKVADLGLAKPTSSNFDSLVSMAGVALGTPAFMAPEQWSGKVSAATDVWALGATLYFLLTGQKAHRARSIVEMMRRVATQPFPDVRELRPEVPAEVAAVLERATRRNPGERYPDGDALADAIAALPFSGSGRLADLRPSAAAPVAPATLPTRKWLDEVKELLRSQPTPLAPARLAALQLRRLFSVAALAVALTVTAGIVGGLWVRGAYGGGAPALLVLAPALVAMVACTAAVLMLQRRWFPAPGSLRAALAARRRAD